MKTPLQLGASAMLGILAQLQTQAASTSVPDSVVGLVAQGDNLPAVPYANLPVHGATYWEILPGGFTAPLPGPIFDPSLPIYAITPTVFVVDSKFGEILVNPRQSAGLSPAAARTAAANAEVTTVSNLITMVQTASEAATVPHSDISRGTLDGTVSPDGQQQPQSGVPYLTIATGSNQFLITVFNSDNSIPYYLEMTPVLGNTNFPWAIVANGTVGVTNFTVPNGPYADEFFQVLMTTNYPGQGIAIFIDSPANGATVQ